MSPHVGTPCRLGIAQRKGDSWLGKPEHQREMPKSNGTQKRSPIKGRSGEGLAME